MKIIKKSINYIENKDRSLDKLLTIIIDMSLCDVHRTNNTSKIFVKKQLLQF